MLAGENTTVGCRPTAVADKAVAAVNNTATAAVEIAVVEVWPL